MPSACPAQVAHVRAHFHGLLPDFGDAGHDRTDDLGAVLGLELGLIGGMGGVGGVFGHLEDSGVHFLHGSGGFRHPTGLFLRAVTRLLDLGGKLFRGRGDDLHHMLQLVGGLEHALGLGPLGPGLGLLGRSHGRLGLFRLLAGDLALGLGLGDLGLEVCDHGAQGLGQDAYLVLLADVEVLVEIALGHLFRVPRRLLDGPGDRAREKPDETDTGQGDGQADADLPGGIGAAARRQLGVQGPGVGHGHVLGDPDNHGPRPAGPAELDGRVGHHQPGDRAYARPVLAVLHVVEHFPGIGKQRANGLADAVRVLAVGHDDAFETDDDNITLAVVERVVHGFRQLLNGVEAKVRSGHAKEFPILLDGYGQRGQPMLPSLDEVGERIEDILLSGLLWA